VAQAERRLRDAALELGPYGAERQQRAVEIAMRDVQEQLSSDDLADLDLSVSQLQEALYGLNRRLAKERSQDSNPLQGLKNTLGSLKDELFTDDDWDDWDRGRSRDPWADSSWGQGSRSGLGFNGSPGLGAYDNGVYPNGRYDNGRYAQPRDDEARYDQPRYDASRYDGSRYEEPRYDDRARYDDRTDEDRSDARWDDPRDDRAPLVSPRRAPRDAAPAGTPRQDPFDGDPWAED